MTPGEGRGAGMDLPGRADQNPSVPEGAHARAPSARCSASRRSRSSALLAAGGAAADGDAVWLGLAGRPGCASRSPWPRSRSRFAAARVARPSRRGLLAPLLLLVAGRSARGRAGAVGAAARGARARGARVSSRQGAGLRSSGPLFLPLAFGVLVVGRGPQPRAGGTRGRRAALPDGGRQPAARRRPRPSSATTRRAATPPSTTRRSRRTTACAGRAARSTRSTRSASRS